MLLAVALAFTACAKKAMTYAEARPQFKAGMKPAEIERTFGAPTTRFDAGEFILWGYTPEELQKRAPDISGFQIVFKDGVAIKVEEVMIRSR
jgi:hypothetical protein